MLYFVGIFQREAGTEGDKEILSIARLVRVLVLGTKYPPKDKGKGTDIL
jgi:hypothetical protein